MDIEVKVVGNIYEDRQELYRFMFAQEVYAKMEEARNKIRTRRKHCEGVTDKEDDFLEELQEILYFELME